MLVLSCHCMPKVRQRKSAHAAKGLDLSAAALPAAADNGNGTTGTLTGRSGTDLSEKIRELLRLADESARLARGRVMPPPFTLVTAPAAAQVDIDAHRAAVAKVQRAGRQVLVQVVAPRDVYTVGPLAVSFTVR